MLFRFLLLLGLAAQATQALLLPAGSLHALPRLSARRASAATRLSMVATAEPTLKDVYGLLETLIVRVDKLEKENALLKASAGGASLTDLCKITKQACDILQPMIQKFYDKINVNSSGDMTKKKADASYFTIVDGVVQHLIINYLFRGNKFAEIVGEEDGSDINIVQKPFHVDELVVPEEFEGIISEARERMSELSKRIDYFSYKSLTVFVDPIDGTREFATGKGEACSMLIGYNDQFGKPVAGIMYRPIINSKAPKVTWAAGAKAESYYEAVLDVPTTPQPRGMLVTDARVSDFIVQLTFELGFVRVPSLASGNRALMLLEGKAGAYIRDTGGFAKWDCSGPGAVLEAAGGVMGKLPPFLSSKAVDSYTYLKTEKNLDFEPGVVSLTLSNARDKSAAINMRTDGEHEYLVDDVDTLKEYSCLLGLVAFNKEGLKNSDEVHNAMLKVIKNICKPTYN